MAGMKTKDHAEPTKSNAKKKKDKFIRVSGFVLYTALSLLENELCEKVQCHHNLIVHISMW